MRPLQQIAGERAEEVGLIAEGGECGLRLCGKPCGPFARAGEAVERDVGQFALARVLTEKTLGKSSRSSTA